MYNKTIWNPGDIITQEKWNNINNNLSILGAYQLPATIEEKEEKETTTTKASTGTPIPTPILPFNITIHKSYDEITKLLKQGVICWYFNNLDGTIGYITEFSDQNRTLNYEIFHSNGTEMTNITTVMPTPIDDPIIIK